MDNWLVNGQPATELPLSDRGLQYGDGLFETIAVHEGVVRFLDQHLERLEQGCERLGLPPIDNNLIRHDIDTLLGEARFGTLKIIVTRGTGRRGYAPPADSVPSRILGFSKGGSGAVNSPLRARLIFCTTPIGRNAQLAGLKTLNRLEQVLARAEIQEVPDAFAEGLMSDDRGNVVCGTMTNLFVVKAGRLLTPRLDQCGVNGIMRANVMQVAEEAGIEVIEEELSRADLASADGLFLTNALLGVVLVETLDSEPVAEDALVAQLRGKLARRGLPEPVL